MTIETHPALSCNKCICRNCLLWWSGRCPYGGCYDDLRAQKKPWNRAHPNSPPRTSWSGWENDQKHWCRGGIFYTTTSCEHYAKYSEKETVVCECLGCNISQFQDGHISCSLVDTIGCEECYRRFTEEQKKNEGDKSNENH